MIPVAKPFITEDEARAAHDTILSGWITQGPRVAEFEERFAEYVGAQYAIAVSSCTTALHLSMIVAGVGHGDEVICPSLSYIATANCIRYVGAIPVFAEVDQYTYNLDPLDAEKRITPRTKAVLLVHQMGLPADIENFREICEQHGLILIEDAACAAGSSYRGAKIGSHSDLVCFSFHPRKVITTGDGGMITTSRKDYADRLRILRQHGMEINDRVRHESTKVMITDHLEVGYNYRMTDVQASIGICQLKKLDWIVSERRKIAQKYSQLLEGLKSIRLPIEPEGCFSNFQSFPIFLLAGCMIERNEIMQKMLDFGISTRSGIMTSHRETAYHNFSSLCSLPISEMVCDQSILLPIFVPMTEDEINKAASAIRVLIDN